MVHGDHHLAHGGQTLHADHLALQSRFLRHVLDDEDGTQGLPPAIVQRVGGCLEDEILPVGGLVEALPFAVDPLPGVPGAGTQVLPPLSGPPRNQICRTGTDGIDQFHTLSDPRQQPQNGGIDEGDPKSPVEHDDTQGNIGQNLLEIVACLLLYLLDVAAVGDVEKGHQKRLPLVVIGGDGDLEEPLVTAPFKGVRRAWFDQPCGGQCELVAEVGGSGQRLAELCFAVGLSRQAEQGQTTTAALANLQGVVDQCGGKRQRSETCHERSRSPRSACILPITPSTVSRSRPSVSRVPSASCGMRRSPPLPKPSARTRTSARCTAAVRCA